MSPPPAHRPVAAFDFDGTLSHGETLLPFLFQLAGRTATATALARAWAGPAERGGMERRDRVKAGLLCRLLAGRPADVVEQAGRDYSATLDRKLKPPILERLRRHQDDGHEVVLVSASLAVYLRPLADQLGLDAVLAVELESVNGVLTGQMQGPNCRGLQKVARLEQWEGDRRSQPLWAYGNSRGDRELLARADHPSWVGGRSRA
ncbi:MAG: HAD-IB family hydrolase [Actinomycetia bacterium]|nr:HAD-IB family hydrolase [Actinomycetes bacterium]